MKYEDQDIYIIQVMNIPDKVRDAVLEKWLTYVKSENLTEWVIWRKHLMNHKNLDPHAII